MCGPRRVIGIHPQRGFSSELTPNYEGLRDILLSLSFIHQHQPHRRRPGKEEMYRLSTIAHC